MGILFFISIVLVCTFMIGFAIALGNEYVKTALVFMALIFASLISFGVSGAILAENQRLEEEYKRAKFLWERGREAAEAKIPIEKNPYEIHSDRLHWFEGHLNINEVENDTEGKS